MGVCCDAALCLRSSALVFTQAPSDMLIAKMFAELLVLGHVVKRRGYKAAVVNALCYKETRWLGIRKQAGNRAGNHQRHTRTRTPVHRRRQTTMRMPLMAIRGKQRAAWWGAWYEHGANLYVDV